MLTDTVQAENQAILDEGSSCLQGRNQMVNSTGSRSVRVLSDMAGLPGRSDGVPLEIDLFDANAPGLAKKLMAALVLYFKGFRYGAIFFNQPGGLLFVLCGLRTLLPLGRARIIAFDIILPSPGISRLARLIAGVKRLLLRRVDLFILHLKEPGGLETYYGIPKARSVFVPFKVNSLESLAELDTTDQGYILAPGRSWRDYTTFSSAMAQLPYPAKILMPLSEEERKAHGTRSVLGAHLSRTVEVVHDDGTSASWNRYLAGARLVVIPISADAISAAGNGTYIQAMALGKCVIITDCPGVRGILENERHALIVPPSAPEELARAIRRAWEDDDLRNRVAEAGQAYATSLGGEERLHADLAREIVRVLASSARSGHGQTNPSNTSS
jgi:glycosyltransferase involved in cell wall biosynthesis